MNNLNEILSSIKCAKVIDWMNEKKYILKQHHSDEELKKFFNDVSKINIIDKSSVVYLTDGSKLVVNENINIPDVWKQII